jgi:hypothetical protein
MQLLRYSIHNYYSSNLLRSYRASVEYHEYSLNYLLCCDNSSIRVLAYLGDLLEQDMFSCFDECLSAHH